MKFTEKTFSELKKKISYFNNTSFDGFENYRIGNYLLINYYDRTNKAELNYFSRLKYYFRSVLKCFIDRYHYRFDNILEGKILLFYSSDHASRQDYVQLMKDVNEKIENSVCFTGNNTGISININRKSFACLRNLWQWKKQISCIEEDRELRAIMLYKLSLAYKWKAELEEHTEILKRMQGLVTIFDAREYENIFAQFCINQGIKTCTLEHGYFSEPFYQDENNFYMGMPYLGFVSDEFWVWGEIERQNAICGGIMDSQIAVVGYPKKVSDNLTFADKIIGIILDAGSMAFESNKRMISVAMEFALENGYSIVLKPHPHDKTDYLNTLKKNMNLDISINHDSIIEYAKKVTFSVCFNSTAYIDLLSINSPVFRYLDPLYRNAYSFLNEEDAFKTSRDLYTLLNCGVKANKNNKDKIVGDVVNSSFLYNQNAKRLFCGENIYVDKRNNT